eukprot:TRINITY_DN811_c0_g1_i3.p1 TRINITY_DN811_c0_g1~~TRINITY_DN811_c0_g1_i3.p1  ORF type:complete len:518 (+),score=104.03 TRINITY_DN811_c0_g1_i3:99-1652(+)
MNWVSAVLLLISLTTVLCAYSTTVDLPEGRIQGFSQNGVYQFYGIPYAQPPVASLRWKPPVKHIPWKDTKQTTQFGPICPQHSGGTVSGSEDCLYLNIWAPDTPGLKPVWFWIHGGSLLDGTGASNDFNGTYIASKGDIVVVTINYRLGPLGFLAHKDLREENPREPTTGNYGLLDQRAALKWVRENIHLFGGDASQITIGGESAGGSSICFHLLMPKSFGLYSKAVIESGACFQEVQTLEEGEKQGHEIQNQFNCTGNAQDVLSCMRKIHWQDLLKQNPRFVADGCIDGYEILKYPYQSLKHGEFNHVPLLAGNTENEGTLWIYNSFQQPIPPTEYFSAIQKQFISLPNITRFMEVYPCASYDPSDCRAALSKAFGDSILTCTTSFISSTYAKKRSENVYSYLFTHHPSWNSHPYMGAYHSAELDFVFNNLWFRHHTVAEEKLAVAVSAYWQNFIKHGNPNHKDEQLGWPTFTLEKNWERADLNLTLSTMTNYEIHQCAYWETVYELFPKYPTLRN